MGNACFFKKSVVRYECLGSTRVKNQRFQKSGHFKISISKHPSGKRLEAFGIATFKRRICGTFHHYFQEILRRQNFRTESIMPNDNMSDNMSNNSISDNALNSNTPGNDTSGKDTPNCETPSCDTSGKATPGDESKPSSHSSFEDLSGAMEQYLKNRLNSQNTVDFIVWFQEKNPFWNEFPDAVAILDSDCSPIWSNRQFRNWFPKVNDKNQRYSIYEILNQPNFLDPNDKHRVVEDPFDAYWKNQQVVYRNMRLPDERFFEVTLSPWECPGKAGTFLKLFIHEATERHKLRGMLENIHGLCNVFNADNNQIPTQEELHDLLFDGIRYLAENQLHYEFMEFRQFNPATKTLDLCAQYGLSQEAIDRKIRPDKVGNGVIGYVAVTRKSYLCKDVRKDSHYLPGGQTARSSMTLPVIFNGELLGVLNIESSKENAFNENDRLYSEIFVHEIANAINLLRVFEKAKQDHFLKSLEKAHDMISASINQIVIHSSAINDHCPPNQDQIKISLYQMLQEVETLRKVSYQLGAILPVTQSDLRISEEFREEWRKILDGKKILLVSPNEALFQQAQEIFNQFQCDLDFARTGAEAFSLMNLAQSQGTEYAAILAPIRLPDYAHTTQFYVDLAGIYGRRHPPVVILQEILTYDPSHVVTNVRMRYPAFGITCTPFCIEPLFKTIEKVLKNAPQTQPVFSSLGDLYDDPWVDSALPVERE